MKRIMNKILAIYIIGLMSVSNLISQTNVYSGTYPITMQGYDQIYTNPLAAGWAGTTAAPTSAQRNGKCFATATDANFNTGKNITYWLPNCGVMTLQVNGTVGRGFIITVTKASDNTQLSRTVWAYTNGTCSSTDITVNSNEAVKITLLSPSSTEEPITATGSSYISYINITEYSPSTPLISSFTVNGVAGTIDDENGTIVLQLPYGSDLSSLEPEITLGGTAIDYSPKGTQDFTNSAAMPVVYTATDGTNTKNYNVTITTPATPPAPEITLSSGSSTQALKVGNTIQDIVYTLVNATGATVNGLPAGLSGSFESTGTNQGTFTISGTITASETPGTFNYTVTATPIVGYEGSDDVTTTGTFYVKSATAINICYLVASTTPSATDTRLYPNLYSNPNYYLTIRQAASTAPSPSVYDEFDLIIVNEIITGTNAEIVALKSVDKPILNLKSFVYQSGRWNWGTADNGKSNNGTITVWQPSHPIFNGITLNEDNTLDLLSGAATKGIQPVDITSVPGSINVATAPKSSSGNPMAVAIHDVPASARGVTNSKYILIPICNDSYDKMTDAALTLINNAIDYLLHGEQFPAPSLNISSFVVDGKSGTIDNVNNIITTILPLGHGLTNIMPVVTLEGVGTIYSPTGAQDFTDSEENPLKYTVTDLINNKIYSVTVKEGTVAVDFPTTKSMFFDGKVLHNPQQINLQVFDISGRLLVVSNKDIDMSSKAKGVYIVKSEEERMKINVR
ncbi:MAG: putative Ig domain-containing protein [Paludibacteraceae bacterium]|nr:putative Ig domain-containing protein [Paludibacteraceae bacterium]